MKQNFDRRATEIRLGLDRRLAAYLAAAGAVGTALASEAQAVVVYNTTVQPFGINGAVPIDFNNDGQVDYEIDHDRVDVSGVLVDYLQIDKNDTNGAGVGESLLPINEFDTFDLNGTLANDTADAAYVVPTAALGDYPAALTAGTTIGPGTPFDFQENSNFNSTGKRIRANRLIDEDAGQVDMALGGLTAGQIQIPTNGPNFLGLNGDVRYLGVKMDLQSAGSDPAVPDVTYGWIGLRITNDADATGEVVGWAYETSGAPIAAGQVPEPSSIIITLLGCTLLCSRYVWKRVVGR